MWASIDEGQQQHLVTRLQRLANAQRIQDEDVKEATKAGLLSHIDYLLRFNEYIKHAANATQFLIVLRSLSDKAMSEMLNMTRSREFLVQGDNRLDWEETAVHATDMGTIASNAATRFSSTGTTHSMTSTLTPVGHASKGCCVIL